MDQPLRSIQDQSLEHPLTPCELLFEKEEENSLVILQRNWYNRYLWQRPAFTTWIILRPLSSGLSYGIWQIACRFWGLTFQSIPGISVYIFLLLKPEWHRKRDYVCVCPALYSFNDTYHRNTTKFPIWTETYSKRLFCYFFLHLGSIQFGVRMAVIALRKQPP